MLQNALRGDALSEVAGGHELRIGLPWIRSMPLSSVLGLAVEIDGEPAGEALRIRLNHREVPADALPSERGWWFIQDRLVLVIPGVLPPASGSARKVSVDFKLMVPYLQGGGDGPLVLPFRLEGRLVAQPPASGGASRDVA